MNFQLKKISCIGSTKMLQCFQFVEVHLHNISGVQIDNSMLVCGNVMVNDVTFRMHCHLLLYLRFVTNCFTLVSVIWSISCVKFTYCVFTSDCLCEYSFRSVVSLITKHMSSMTVSSNSSTKHKLCQFKKSWVL